MLRHLRFSGPLVGGALLAIIALVALFVGSGSPPPAQAFLNDSDGDTVIDLAEVITGSDPNDANKTPEDEGADVILGTTLCRDGFDNDGDGATDEADPGCLDSDGDIVSDQMETILGSDPQDSSRGPEDSRFDAVLNSLGFGFIVTCADGLDNDGDGASDAADSGCPPIMGDADPFDDRVEKLFGSDPADPNSVPEHETVNPGSCGDGRDNDGDGLTDGAEESCQPIENDNIGDATVIGSLPFEDGEKITTATTEAADPNPSCFYEPPATVWYTYSATSDGVLVADTAGSNFPNVVAVWTRRGARFSEVACASGFSPGPFATVGARASFYAVQGETYYIEVAGYVFPNEPGTLHLAFEAGHPPANDNYGTPREVTALPFSDSVDTRDATTEFGEPGGSCIYERPASSVWYRYQADADDLLVADTIDSNYPAGITVWTDSVFGLAQVNCSSYGARLAFEVEAGRTYFVQISSLARGLAGTLDFGLEIGVPPENDDFANARNAAPLPFEETVDTFTATTEFDEPSPSCSFAEERNTVWYRATAQQTGYLKASAGSQNSPFPTVIGVYSGTALNDLNEITCGYPYYLGPTVAFPVTAGQTYYIQVGQIFYGGKGFSSAGIGGPPIDGATGEVTFQLETLVVPSCAPSEFTLEDPLGDQLGGFGPPAQGVDAPPDVTSVSGGDDGRDYCLRVQFDRPLPQPSDDPFENAASIRFEFDMDEDRNTGYGGDLQYSCPNGPQLGVELAAYINVPSQVLVPLDVFFSFPGRTAGRPPEFEQQFGYAIFGERSLQFIIPMDVLGDDAFRFGMAVYAPGGFDCVPNGGAAVSPDPASPGDVNCDGSVNTVDVSLILQQFAGILQTPLPCQYVGDVNNNGSVGPIDATLILQYTSGMLSAFPAGG